MLNRIGHRIIWPLIVVWLLLTVGSMILRYNIWNRFKSSLDASSQSMQLETSLDHVFSALQDAETSERGFILTSNLAYLEPFKQAETQLPELFAQINTTTTLDVQMQSDLVRLRTLAEQKMALMRETIRVREKGLNAAVTSINSGREKEMMDQIRKVIAGMHRDRQSIFSSAWEATRQDFEHAQSIGIISGILGFGAGLLALYLAVLARLQEKNRIALLEAKARAEKTVNEKSAFLANMSHEIRTPMNAILGFSELLQDERLTAKQSQYVRSINTSGKALLELINNVLDLSKLEAGKMELQVEPTDLTEVFGFLQTMFAQQAAMKSLEFRCVCEDLPHGLILDRLRMRQLLVNLVGNAIKFTPRGSVWLRANWKNKQPNLTHGALLIEIQDTGVGISPEKQLEIFKPFVQSAINRNLESEGTGLGLNITQRLTEIMGGTIAVESVLGEGSLFRVTLPHVAVSNRMPASDFAEPLQTVDFNEFAPATILVADDHATNRELMSGLFASTHHQLLLATNGREALEILAQKKPDIVLMDIRMPVLDGPSALVELRKRGDLERLPVIAVTASSQPDDEKEVRGQFSGYLRKPFSRRELYAELAQFLPRASKKKMDPANGPSGDSAQTAMMATARSADHMEILVAELKMLQRSRWPMLRDSLAIKETASFARALRELAQTMPCPPLAAYAEQLGLHADNYSIGDMEQRLAEFPALVASLEPRKTI